MAAWGAGMAGLAEARGATAAQWAVVFALALLVHCVPIFCLTLAAAPRFPEDEIVLAVDFTDSLSKELETAARAEPDGPAPAPPASGPQAVRAAEPEKRAPAPAPEPVAARGEQALPPSAAAVAVPEEKARLKLLELEPLVPAPGAAFDESKSTKEAPQDAYLSDRTSTAADRGPKDLPRGDPYMDKGESKAIRYQQRRGEGNLPALPSGDTSGSVKKEGNPDAGRGVPDARPPDLKQPLKAPAAPVAVEPKEKVAATEPLGEERKTEEPRRDAAAKALTDGLGPGRGKPPAAQTTASQPAKEKTPSPYPLPRGEGENSTVSQRPVQPESARAATADELEAFRALLDGRGKTDGRGGETGEKPGAQARPGAKGHEGDGTLRPGHDEAVSDVTTINLESSAAEFDEARFAKKFDARTAYVKPLARRIDNKWKAERVARNRWRALHGVVTFTVVVRKDGKLLSATEASRSPRDLPDEYAASAKVAIERAAEPLSEPFAGEVAKYETLEFAFNFLY